MNLPIKDRLLSSFGVLALAVILVVLGALQYRWSRELNDAASDRMRAGLYSSMVGIREDLNREFAGLSLAFDIDVPSGGPSTQAETYTERLESWRRTAAHPPMIANVFLWEDVTGRGSRLLRLDSLSRQFEPATWPEKFERFRNAAGALSAEMSDFANHAPERTPAGGAQVHHHPPRLMPWEIDQTIPAVLHPVISRSGGRNKPAAINWVILELDSSIVERSLLPELAQKYFGGPQGLIYDVAVVSEGPERRIIYSSNSQLGTEEKTPVDAKMYVFGPPNGIGAARDAGFPPHAGLGGEHEWHGFGRGGPLRLEPFRRNAAAAKWVLVAKHRKGSLEAALVSMRFRHTAISFGILLMLAITTAMIIAATRRAQRLAKLQMDFVAGVSHELRTPLAVISSAADNIAEGIIEDKQKLTRYGEVIRNQSRQLTHLVEEILLFAATRQERYQYSMALVDPAEIIRTAIANSSELIRTAGIAVEEDIDDDLPSVRADLPAVSHCVQNLIVNAIKYGGDSRWIGIRAWAAGENGEREVRISIEDKGIGIDESELQRIFDPFYRSPAALGAQIHGTGLGLALAKGVAAGMGGRVTVESKLGEGSVFVLHLPCAPEATEKLPVAEVTSSGDPGK